VTVAVIQTVIYDVVQAIVVQRDAEMLTSAVMRAPDCLPCAAQSGYCWKAVGLAEVDQIDLWETVDDHDLDHAVPAVNITYHK